MRRRSQGEENILFLFNASDCDWKKAKFGKKILGTRIKEDYLPYILYSSI